MSRVGGAFAHPASAAQENVVLLAQANKPAEKPAQVVQGIGVYSWFEASSGKTHKVHWPVFKDDNWRPDGYYVNDPKGKRVNLDAWSPRAADGKAQALVLEWLDRGLLRPPSSLSGLAEKWAATSSTASNAKPIDMGMGEVQGLTAEGKVLVGLLIKRVDPKGNTTSFYVKGLGPKSHSLPKNIRTLEQAQVSARQLIASDKLKNFFREGNQSAFRFQSIRVDLGEPNRPSFIGQLTQGVVFPKRLPDNSDARNVVRENNIPMDAAKRDALLENSAAGGKERALIESAQGVGSFPIRGEMSPAFQKSYREWSRVYASAKLLGAAQSFAQGATTRPSGGLVIPRGRTALPSKVPVSNPKVSNSTSPSTPIPRGGASKASPSTQTDVSRSDVANLPGKPVVSVAPLPKKITLSAPKPTHVTATAITPNKPPLAAMPITTNRWGITLRIDQPFTGYKITLEIWVQRVNAKGSLLDLKAIAKQLEKAGLRHQLESNQDANKLIQWIARHIPANIGLRMRLQSPPSRLGSQQIGVNKDQYLELINVKNLIANQQVIKGSDGKLRLNTKTNNRGEEVISKPLEINVGQRLTGNPGVVVNAKVPLVGGWVAGPSAAVSSSQERKILIPGGSVINSHLLNIINKSLNHPSTIDFYRNAGVKHTTKIHQENIVPHGVFGNLGSSQLPAGYSSLEALLPPNASAVSSTGYKSGVVGANVRFPEVVSLTGAGRIEVVETKLLNTSSK